MSDLPKALYHYTSQHGLLGILDENALWATKIHYLNDSQEYHLAFLLASDVLQARLKSTRSQKEKRKINCLVENLKSIELLNVCVCSFSEQRDLLSQWRAYANGGAGFSLGLKSSNLLHQAKEQGFSLVQCEYDEGRQKSIVEALVTESLAKDFNTTPGRIDPARPRTIVVLPTGGDFAERFSRLAPLIKSHAFHEEGEWRLVSNHGIDVRAMSFRPGKSMLTPYIPFKLGAEVPTFLESVTVGPTPHASLAESAVHSLIARHRAAQEVKVRGSRAPFRTW